VIRPYGENSIIGGGVSRIIITRDVRNAVDVRGRSLTTVFRR